jgi:hypothetical protein
MLETIKKISEDLKAGFKAAYSIASLYKNDSFQKKIKKKMKWQRK